MPSRSPVADGAAHRSVVAWVVRAVSVITLLPVALWWSSTHNFAGTTYCERHHVVVCDDWGLDSLAPFVLWPVTAFATLVPCVVAAVAAPRTFRHRLVWAAMVGCVVFAANLANLLWAVLITALAGLFVTYVTDEVRRARDPEI